MSNVYVVTEYWDNGESYEDSCHNEKPVKVFDKLLNAREYCKSKNSKEIKKSNINSKLEIYELIEEKKYVECPIDKEWWNCDEGYDDDYCEKCYSHNRDIGYDYSYKRLHIYEVSFGR